MLNSAHGRSKLVFRKIRMVLVIHLYFYRQLNSWQRDKFLTSQPNGMSLTRNTDLIAVKIIYLLDYIKIKISFPLPVGPPLISYSLLQANGFASIFSGLSYFANKSLVLEEFKDLSLQGLHMLKTPSSYHVLGTNISSTKKGKYVSYLGYFGKYTSSSTN